MADMKPFIITVTNPNTAEITRLESSLFLLTGQPHGNADASFLMLPGISSRVLPAVISGIIQNTFTELARVNGNEFRGPVPLSFLAHILAGLQLEAEASFGIPPDGISRSSDLRP